MHVLEVIQKKIAANSFNAALREKGSLAIVQVIMGPDNNIFQHNFLIYNIKGDH